jgi:hypothetical protein
VTKHTISSQPRPHSTPSPQLKLSRSCSNIVRSQNSSIAGKRNLVVNKRVLNRVLRLKDLIQLLKSPVLRLRHHKVKDRRLHRVPHHENNVSLPLDLGESNRPGELVEHAAGVDGQGREGHSLGAHLEGEDFDGVEGLQGRDSDRVDGAEDEDHGDRGAGCVLVGFAAFAEEGGGGCDADPDDAGADHGEEHEGAAADAVDEGRTSQSENELEAGVSEVDVGFGDFLGVACGVEDSREEVSKHLGGMSVVKHGREE